MKRTFLITILLILNSYIFGLNTPTQNSPDNGAANVQTDATLRINQVSGATYYDYMLDTVASFDSPALRTKTHSSSYGGWIPGDLFFNKNYYWKIRARNATDTSLWSSVWIFTTNIYGVTQSLPSSGSIDQDLSLTLRINDEGATNYDYQLDTIASFDSPDLKEYTHTDAYGGKTVSDLRYGQKYFWRVRGRNDADTSEWTETWTFTTKNYGVTQSSPANNSIDINPRVTLWINTVEGSENYDYQLDTVSSFDSPDLKEYTHTDSYGGKTVSDLRYGQTYFWRVRGRNDADTSEWTETWTFTTKNYGVTQSSPANNSIDINPRVTLWINTVSGSENYDYQLDTIASFDSPDLKEYTHTDTYGGQTVSDLRYGQTYFWRVRGRNDADTSEWTETWTFTTKIYGATQSSPANGNENIALNTTLWINTVSGSENYDYQIDTSLNFNSALLIEYTHTDSYSGYNVSLTRYGQRYYWRVRGRNDSDTSIWSDIWNFKTDYELTDAPILISPGNGSTDISYTSISLDWNSVSGADLYTYRVSTDSDFSNIVKSGTTSLTDFTLTDLYPYTVYYWQIKEENNNGYSPWSEVWSFTTESAVLTAPVLISPENNATGINYTSVNFSWESVFGADNYNFEISQDDTFTTGVSDFISSDTSRVLSGLNSGTKYYWRISATDGITTSAWSDIWNFTTSNPLDIENINASKITIYPVPSDKYLIISGLLSPAKIIISDISGKIVLFKNFYNGEEINVSQIKSGFYILNISDGMKKIAKKLTIKH